MVCSFSGKIVNFRAPDLVRYIMRSADVFYSREELEAHLSRFFTSQGYRPEMENALIVKGIISNPLGTMWRVYNARLSSYLNVESLKNRNHG